MAPLVALLYLRSARYDMIRELDDMARHQLLTHATRRRRPRLGLNLSAIPAH